MVILYEPNHGPYLPDMKTPVRGDIVVHSQSNQAVKVISTHTYTEAGLYLSVRLAANTEAKWLPIGDFREASLAEKTAA